MSGRQFDLALRVTVLRDLHTCQPVLCTGKARITMKKRKQHRGQDIPDKAASLAAVRPQ